MPSERLFHKRAGHSDRVNKLSDIEEIAWNTYILGADDFGVMRFHPIALQQTHDRLAKRPGKAVAKMLDRILEVGLVKLFEHEDHRYCYRPDWQDWARIRYPSRTINPRIPEDLFVQCSLPTRWLHTVWPGGGRDSKLATWLPPGGWTGDGNGSGNLAGNGSGNGSATVPPRVREGVRVGDPTGVARVKRSPNDYAYRGTRLHVTHAQEDAIRRKVGRAADRIALAERYVVWDAELAQSQEPFDTLAWLERRILREAGETIRPAYRDEVAGPAVPDAEQTARYLAGLRKGAAS